MERVPRKRLHHCLRPRLQHHHPISKDLQARRAQEGHKHHSTLRIPSQDCCWRYRRGLHRTQVRPTKDRTIHRWLLRVTPSPPQLRLLRSQRTPRVALLHLRHNPFKDCEIRT